MHEIVKGFGWLLVAIGLLISCWAAYSVQMGGVRASLEILMFGGGVMVLGCICWALGAILERLTEIRDRLRTP